MDGSETLTEDANAAAHAVSEKVAESILYYSPGNRCFPDRLAAIGAPIHEEDRVDTLLGSLPKSYSMLVTALESREDDISLKYVQQGFSG